jgi:hypothetical protein
MMGLVTVRQVDDAAPLMEPLADQQVDLLTMIWRAVCRPEEWSGAPTWPTWDLAARQLYLTRPDLADATEVWLSLPTIARDPINLGAGVDPLYGLVWLSGWTQRREPPAGVRIGLSIAGLAQLARHREAELGAVPDRLASLIGDLAEKEAALRPTPDGVAEGTLQLGELTGWLTMPQPDRVGVVPDKVTREVLVREYADVRVDPPLADSGHTVGLGYNRLRAYRGVRSAADYVRRITELAAAAEQPEHLVSPLTLVQTLDYLGYVLAADPTWEADRLTLVAGETAISIDVYGTDGSRVGSSARRYYD